MAFLDFAQALAGPQMAVGAARPAPAVPAISVEAQATSFSAQEWQIVDLARTDGLRSLRGPGRFARLRKWIGCQGLDYPFSEIDTWPTRE